MDGVCILQPFIVIFSNQVLEKKNQLKSIHNFLSFYSCYLIIEKVEKIKTYFKHSQNIPIFHRESQNIGQAQSKHKSSTVETYLEHGRKKSFVTPAVNRIKKVLSNFYIYIYNSNKKTRIHKMEKIAYV